MTQDDLLAHQGINLLPSGASLSDTKPDLSGVMADQAAFLFSNQIPTTISHMVPSDGPVLFSNVPTSHVGITPISVSMEGQGSSSMAPVILTIPSLPGVMPSVYTNNQATTASSVAAMTSGVVKPLFLPVNRPGGVITRAPDPTMPITSIVSSSVTLATQSTASQFLQPVASPVKMSAASMAHSMLTSTSSHFGPIPGSVIASRPSVIRHTQHAKTQPLGRADAIPPSDLILRNMSSSPRKTPTSNGKWQTEKTDHPVVSTSTGRDPIIVTPHFNPYLPGLPRFPGIPGMMLPGQLPPFTTPVVPPPPPQASFRADQPTNTKRRRTESGKENLDGKPTDLTNMSPMPPPFFPVSVPMPIPRLVHPFQSLPEQDEPCDLSMPKKRKHNIGDVDRDRQAIKERKQSDSPHLRTLHGTNLSGRIVSDFPSEVSNHRTHHVVNDGRLYYTSSHGKVTVPAENHYQKPPTTSAEHYQNLLNSGHVKMTPLPRGSITQGVINPPTHQVARSSHAHHNKDSNAHSTKHQHPHTHTKPTTTSSYEGGHTPNIPHTTSSIPSFHHPDHHQPSKFTPTMIPDFSNPHLLAAAAANGFRPPFPFVHPPHLLHPQLLANLPPHLAANREELLRYGGFLMPPMGFPPPGLVGGAMSSPSQVKKEGQNGPAAFAFHS